MAQQIGGLRRQALWFGLVGAAAAATHFAVLVLLVRWGGWMPARANVAAFVMAFGVSFGGHFRLTFYRPEQRGWWASLWRWLAASLAGFAANQVLFVAGLRLLGQAAYVPVWLAVTVLVTVITFAAGRFWAFARISGK